MNRSENASTPRRARAGLAGVVPVRWLPTLAWLLVVVAAPLARAQVAEPDPDAAPPERPPSRLVRMPGGWQWRDAPTLRFRRGDDPAWAAPDLDDSDWETISPLGLPSRDGIYWIRFRIHRGDDAPAAPLRDGVALAVVASYDLYWDGRLIGRNGRVGADAAAERPGNVDTLWQVPAELVGPGEHVLALRLSSFRTGFPSAHYGINFLLGNFARMLVGRTRQAIQSVVAVGGMIVLALGFAVVGLFLDRRPAMWLFAAVALAAAALQGVQAWRWLYDYPYPWHYPRLVALALLAGLLGLSLVAALMAHFGFPARRRIFAGLAVADALAWSSSGLYHVKGAALFVAAIGFALGLAVWAVRRRRRYAGVVLAGVAVSALTLLQDPRDFLERTFLFSFGATLGGVIISVARQWRDERAAARQAQLTAARLEIELLKKNIQPHFLMNTLTTVMEVVEQDPPGAVALIGALADEFRILARVSGERLIPLGQELELCRAHLRIMSLRRERTWELRAVDVDPAALVPPALFHTLIENGLTHQGSGGADGSAVFRLRGDRYEGRVRYELLAPGAPDVPPAPAAPADGTGLRYVKARLEESFPGRWHFEAGPSADGWRTVVELREA